MNLTADGSSGLRRAALTLHALGAADRDWLLQRLPLPERETLAELLVELRELDIPRDAQVIRVALSETPATATAIRSDARALCLALAKESPALQGLLLATLGEAERQSILAHWPYEVHARPVAVAEPAWTADLRDALVQSWREVASAQERAA
jgi:hypothetical protein